MYNPHEGLKLEQMIVKKLGPGYVSHRAGAGGGRVPYIEAHRLISLANEMFGFNGQPFLCSFDSLPVCSCKLQAGRTRCARRRSTL